jgi:hypoxanthine phosphoribosyltransferase
MTTRARIAQMRMEKPMEHYKILISSDAIQKRVAELAQQISEDYAGKRPLIITLLKGAFIFLADLVRHLTVPHEIDFITLSSYSNGTRRNHKVTILDHLRSSVVDRHVLIVDEIIDTGHTIYELIRTLGAQQARSLRICALLDKPTAREVTVPTHYIGFTIPRVFVVGYGLDFMEHFRNLPYIAELKTDVRITELNVEESILARLQVEGFHEGLAPPIRTGGPMARGVAAENPLADKPDS